MDIMKVLRLFADAFKGLGTAFVELGKSILKAVWTLIKTPIKWTWKYALRPVRKALHWFFYVATAGRLQWQLHKNILLLVVGDPDDWSIYPTFRVKTTRAGSKTTRSVRFCWLHTQVMLDFTYREQPAVVGTRVSTNSAGEKVFEVRVNPKASTTAQVTAVKKVMAREQRKAKVKATGKVATSGLVQHAVDTKPQKVTVTSTKGPALTIDAKAVKAKPVKKPQTLEEKIRARSNVIFQQNTTGTVVPSEDDLAAKRAKKAADNKRFREAKRAREAAARRVI